MIRLSCTLAAVAAAVIPFAAIGQTPSYPAPIEALREQGLEVVGELPSVAGLKAYAGYVDQQPYALYVSPDGKYVFVGSAFDAKGENLTRDPLKDTIAKPLSQHTLQQLQDSSWVAEGDAQAGRVIYTFTDPNCPYCHRLWQQAEPWIRSGKVQVRHILVGILQDTSPGKAAAILAAADPSKALAEHESRMAQGGIAPMASIPTELQAKLLANQTLMRDLGASATPATFYTGEDGLLHMKMGAPANEAELKTIMGPD